MTAGSGIIHQEMPKGDPAGRMHGFQLWANLPSSLKMTAPRYQEVKAAGHSRKSRMTTARRFASSAANFGARTGPVDGIAADPIYLDVSVPPGKRKLLPVETTRHAFAYVFAGSRKILQRVRSPGGAHGTRRMGGHDSSRRRRTTARWCCSIAATK